VAVEVGLPGAELGLRPAEDAVGAAELGRVPVGELAAELAAAAAP
jgi:hypothetical protein